VLYAAGIQADLQQVPATIEDRMLVLARVLTTTPRGPDRRALTTGTNDPLLGGPPTTR